MVNMQHNVQVIETTEEPSAGTYNKLLELQGRRGYLVTIAVTFLRGAGRRLIGRHGTSIRKRRHNRSEKDFVEHQQTLEKEGVSHVRASLGLAVVPFTDMRVKPLRRYEEHVARLISRIMWRYATGTR